MKLMIHLILTLSILGIIAGGSLALVDNWSSPLIAANQQAETEKAIFLVQPEGKTYEKVNISGVEVFKVFNADSNFIGYSLVYEGNGFQGKIRLIVGLSSDLKKITTLEILEQVETPGLGTKVTEAPFIDQFKGLETTPNVKWVKGAVPDEANEIQAVTGATISSKSVVAIINAGVEKMRKLKEDGVIK